MKRPQIISSASCLILLMALHSTLAFAPQNRAVPHQFASRTEFSRNDRFTNRNVPGIDEKTSATSVQMVAATPATVAAITGAITGGVFAGGLHAIAGPDHLAALLPRCCGQRWYKAGRVGALWGMGHGVSARSLV